VELTPAASAANRDAVSKELSHHIKSYIGISTRITIGEPGTIARSEGKAQRVSDLRNKG